MNGLAETDESECGRQLFLSELKVFGDALHRLIDAVLQTLAIAFADTPIKSGGVVRKESG